jgi:cytochrome c553
VRRAAAALLAACALDAGAQAPPPEKSRTCAPCHGASGISVQPDAPNLAGQPAVYLVAQLRAYRGGTRTSQVMNVIAKPLSDEDIVQLAEWFSSIEVEVKRVPR